MFGKIESADAPAPWAGIMRESIDFDAVFLRPALFVADADPTRRAEIATKLARLEVPIRPLSDGRALLDGAAADEVGCVVLGLRMCDPGEIELVGRLKAGTPLAVVVASDSTDVESAVRAVRAGALNFLPRDAGGEKFRNAVSEAIEASRAGYGRWHRRRDLIRRIDCLDGREMALLRLLAGGFSNKSAARRLGLGLRTVERLRAQIQSTLKVDSMPEAIGMLGIAEAP